MRTDHACLTLDRYSKQNQQHRLMNKQTSLRSVIFNLVEMISLANKPFLFKIICNSYFVVTRFYTVLCSNIDLCAISHIDPKGHCQGLLSSIIKEKSLQSHSLSCSFLAPYKLLFHNQITYKSLRMYFTLSPLLLKEKIMLKINV